MSTVKISSKLSRLFGGHRGLGGHAAAGPEPSEPAGPDRVGAAEREAEPGQSISL